VYVFVVYFMSELDKKLVSTCPVPLLSSLVPHHLQEQYRYLDWSRFRDDGFALLLDSEHIQPFTECLQSLHPPNIKWTVSHGKSATYLDVSLSVRDGMITTDVFSKHNHSYLPPSSCHSPAVFKGFAQGIGTRLRMICSQDDDLDRRLEEYARYLTISGWKYKTAKERLVEGAKTNRKKLLQQPRKKREKKIAWVSTYDPRVPSKTAIINKNIHLLHASAVNIEIFPPRTIISADKKRPNLAQIYKPTVPQRHVYHGPKSKPGFFPCGNKCDTCRHSKETTVLVSPWDGRHWPIKQHLTCTTPNTVYVVMCTVHNDWYVGSTTDLKARWRNHKSDTKLRKATKCGVADHVTRFPHPDDPQLDFLTIVAVEAVREKRNLIVRENYWMCNLGTIFKGMNSRKDLNTVISSSSSSR
uniref:GIY-YIG nuclease family protein n=1 Tax=Thiolapillus sp. TaxID=2017437 RepID=UPI003AF6EDD9